MTINSSADLTLAESTEPAGQLSAVWAIPFNQARALFDKRLIDAGLLQLGMINTTAVLRQANLAIPQIHQILAFHPRYMRVILETDPAAIVEAPLKFAFLERGTDTEVRCADPLATFGRHATLTALGEELHALVSQLLTPR